MPSKDNTDAETVKNLLSALRTANHLSLIKCFESSDYYNLSLYVSVVVTTAIETNDFSEILQWSKRQQ